MKAFISIYIILAFGSCQTKNEKPYSRQIELVLLEPVGRSHSLTEYNMKSSLYVRIRDYNNIVFKTNLGEVERFQDSSKFEKTYQWSENVSNELIPFLDYLDKYVEHKKSGILVGEIPKNCMCELFGEWVLIYSEGNVQTKHFFFGCCGLPDSVHQLCNKLRRYTPHNLKKYHSQLEKINTDSLLKVSYKILSADIRKLELRFPPPEQIQIQPYRSNSD